MTDVAIRWYNGPECAHWNWRGYRVTTYPGSNLIRMAPAEATHRRVKGRHIEAGARAAIKRALGKRWSIHTLQDAQPLHLGIITAYDHEEAAKRTRALWPMFYTFVVVR